MAAICSYVPSWTTVQNHTQLCVTGAVLKISSGLMEAQRVIHEIALQIIHGFSEWAKNVDLVGATLKLVDAAIHFCRMGGISDPSFAPLSATIRHVTNFFNARGIFGKIDGLSSGKDAVKDVPKGEFNLLRVVSRTSLAVADTIATGKWLAEMKITGDGESFEKPLFTAVHLSPNHMQAAFAVTGFACNIASVTRRIIRSGEEPTVKDYLTLASDVAKLAAIVLFSMHTAPCRVFAIAAQSIANIAFLTNNFVPEVKVA